VALPANAILATALQARDINFPRKIGGTTTPLLQAFV
jgi:hypothetical protein